MVHSFIVLFILVATVTGFRLHRSLSVPRMRAVRAVDQTNGPSRHNTCKILVSGVVGSEAKEIYLKSGHYVVNFAMALVGHFNAVHPQEHFKPSEAMWLSAEMWGDVAKAHYSDIKKGHAFRGLGYIIQNKWVDKLTGEERKMYKLRITKVMTKQEFSEVLKLLDDSIDERQSVGNGAIGDSNFSDEIPTAEDQTQLCDRNDQFSELNRGRSLQPQQGRPQSTPHSYPFARGPSELATERAQPFVSARSGDSEITSRAAAATGKGGAAIWNLLENAKEGDYLPWWE